MQINSENIINDALKLRKIQKEFRSKKTSDTNDGAKQTKQIKVTLDNLRISLKTHQQNIAKLQMEHLGLDQIDKNLDLLLKQNPNDFETLRQAKNEISSTLQATRFQQEELIPESTRKALGLDLSMLENVKSAKEAVSLRRDTVSGNLSMEFNQINKIQVSVENIISLNMPSDQKIEQTLDDIKNGLSIQDKIQHNVDPATVMGLLQG